MSFKAWTEVVDLQNWLRHTISDSLKESGLAEKARVITRLIFVQMTVIPELRFYLVFITGSTFTYYIEWLMRSHWLS